MTPMTRFIRTLDGVLINLDQTRTIALIIDDNGDRHLIADVVGFDKTEIMSTHVVDYPNDSDFRAGLSQSEWVFGRVRHELETWITEPALGVIFDTRESMHRARSEVLQEVSARSKARLDALLRQTQRRR